MNIEEYADVLNLELRIFRYPNQNNRYSAAFEHCETKEDAGSAGLTSEYGNGRSPDEAISSYVDKIRNKVLVIHAMDEKRRREYVVPKSITAT